MNHPNRSRRRKAAGSNPKAAEITQLREEMELTQTDFGALVYRSRSIVAQWEAGKRRCPPDTWEYLCLLQAFPEVERARRKWLNGHADNQRESRDA